MKSVRTIYEYYKRHRYQTVIMGASFRKVEQIGAGRLRSPDHRAEPFGTAENSDRPVERKLTPSTEGFHQPAPLAEAEFRWLHNQDAMAVEKLAEGIRLFAVDQQKLEDMLAAQL
ncbi:transaldolase family protein [Serratia marcescens]